MASFQIYIADTVELMNFQTASKSATYYLIIMEKTETITKCKFRGL